MLRIVILPAAVSPANIISQKPRGFSITFRIGKYHSGQSPEYHFFVHRRSKHRILSAKIRYLSVFRSYRRQHKFCTAFFLMKPLRRAFFVRHASVGALQGPGCPLPAAHERFVQSDMKKQTPPTCHCEAPKGPWQSREGSHDFADGFPVIQSGTARFPRRFAPRNDKPVYLTPLNLCREYRQPPWRSLSAATDAIGAYRYNGSPYESPVRFPALKNM